MIFDPVFSPISWLMIEMDLIELNVNFLGDQILAVVAICWVNIWRGIPFFGISILAGLQAVPPELHEQAAIDGANWFSRSSPSSISYVHIRKYFNRYWRQPVH